MPCVALLAPAGILLVVILGVLPLTLPSSSAGNTVYLAAREDPARRIEYPVVQGIVSRGMSSQSPGDAVPASEQLPIAPQLGRAAAPASAAGVPVSRQGPSSIGAPRVSMPLHAPQTGAIGNTGRRLHLVWPSRGAVTSPFGWRTHPIFGMREFHTGIDIAGQSGAPVVAAYPGTVRFVGWRNGYGQQVTIDHGGGLETTYSHLSAASVRLGAQVEQGREIGRIGSTGWSTGPHLLFEVLENGIPRDPTGYLD